MDLFPESLHPKSLGFRAVTLMAPHFFAIYPDADDIERIREFKRELHRRLDDRRWNWRSDDVLHVSIAQWGTARRMCEPYEIALHKAAGRFTFPAFDIVLVNTARYSKENGLVLVADKATADKCHGLRNALADAQRPEGLYGDRGRFSPHMTLAYGPDIPDEPLPIPPLRFRARVVGMMLSEIGKGRHLHVDAWPLDES